MKSPLISTAEDFERRFGDEFWLYAAETICKKHSLSFQRLTRAVQSEHIIVLADDSFVIKIFSPFRGGFQRERDSLRFARAKTSLPLPEILHEGEIGGFDYLVMTQLHGRQMTRDHWLRLKPREQKAIVTELAIGLRELHSHDAGAIDFDWNGFIENQAATVIERQKAKGATAKWLEHLPSYLEENLPLLPKDLAPVFLHGDVHFGNLRFNEENRISGLFDFADSLKGFHEYEFAAICVLMIQGQGEIQREFFRAYGYKESEINETLRRRLMLLTILYECSDLRKYALRLDPKAVNYTLDELERGIFNFC